MILESVTANKNVIVDKIIDDVNLRIEIENLFSKIVLEKAIKKQKYFEWKKNRRMVKEFL